MLPLMPPGTETSQIRRKPVASRMEMMPHLMPPGRLMPPLMPHQLPLIERRVATVATDLGSPGKTIPCAITGGEVARDERQRSQRFPRLYLHPHGVTLAH